MFRSPMKVIRLAMESHHGHLIAEFRGTAVNGHTVHGLLCLGADCRGYAPRRRRRFGWPRETVYVGVMPHPSLSGASLTPFVMFVWQPSPFVRRAMVIDGICAPHAIGRLTDPDHPDTIVGVSWVGMLPDDMGKEDIDRIMSDGFVVFPWNRNMAESLRKAVAGAVTGFGDIHQWTIVG